MKSMSKSLLLVGLAILGLVLWNSGWLEQLSFENLKARQGELQAWTDQNFWRALILYFVVYVAVTAAALPGAAVMTLAGGAVFGLLWGTVVVSFASTLGATLCFVGARWLLRDWVSTRFRATYDSVQKGLDKEGSFYLFTLRLIPAVPFFVINLVFGLTRMSATRFFVVSQIGMLPGTLAYVNAGTQLSRIDSLAGVLSGPVLLSFVVLGLVPWFAKGAVRLWTTHRLYARFTKPSRFDYDVVVIGAGAAGLVSSYVTAALKGKVALVEKHRMGGDCLYTGCVPSKALIRSAHVAHLMRKSRDFGLQDVDPQVDFARVFSRIQDIIGKIEPNDSVERYTGLGVDCVQGSAFVEDPYRVRVGDRVLTTRNIIVATGASPVVPDLPGLKDVTFYTSENLWQMQTPPRRLLVLGGGPIGCELAQSFQRLGCQTTLVERSRVLLQREDPEVSEFILDVFRREGMGVRLGGAVVRFERQDGFSRAYLEDGTHVDFDAVIVALGRRAHTRGFGLEELGLAVRANGTLETDEFLRTKYPNILACGDVTGPFQFTHAASHQAGYAVLNALFAPLKKFKADYTSLPWCTYVDPEVGRVGLNETDARAQGVEYDVHRYDLDHLDRAICEGENRGFVKVLTAKGGGRILGVTIVGAHAGEIQAEFVLALRKKMSLNEIMNTVHAYPTFAEANRFVAGVWKRKTAPQGALAFLQKFHSWRRGS